MTFEPPLPRDVWEALPESARALIQAMHHQIQSLQAEVANLKARLDANSSIPPAHHPPTRRTSNASHPGPPQGEIGEVSPGISG